MATTLTSNTFSNTYKDDFADSASYHRILFNSGKALQARELTQMQTILQEQVRRFGDNIFKEGSVVKPGSVALNTKYEFVKLNTSSNALPTDTSNLVGTSFTGQTSNVIAKVIEVVDAVGSDPATLYVQYTNTLSSTASTAAPIRFDAGEDINNGSVTLTVQTTNTTSNPAMGTGSRFSVATGIYYTKGFFVFTDNQSKIISKYSDAPDADIGFKVVEEISSVADDTSLYDNQGTTPNLASPGADRLRIRLVIALRSDIASDENFIHLATIKNGAIYSTNEPLDAYEVPNEVIAQRIFENSGNYIVEPFTVKFDVDSDNTKLQLQVSEGVAVVEGFRAARYFPTTLRIDRSTQTVTLENQQSAADFGNYVIVNPSNTKGLPNINVFQKLNLRDAVDHGGSTIGTARVRAVNEGTGTNYNYHLFDIQMNSGKAFRNVKSIGSSTSDYFNPTLENGKAVLKEPLSNLMLFSIPEDRPQSISDITIDVQRRITGVTSNGAGAGTVPSLSGTGETYINTGDWIAAKVDSSISDTIVFASDGTFTGAPASSTLEVLAYVRKASATVRQKTLTDATRIGGMESDGSGTKFLSLRKADIFSLTEVVNAADSAEDYSNRFYLDNGQRDAFYDVGRLVLKAGNSAPSGNISAKFKHFEHATSGDFFAVNSYTGQVDYAQIPNHVLSNGARVPLREVIDLRSVKDSNGEFASSGLGARVHEVPQPNDLVQFDAIHFLPTAGKLVINTEGNLVFERGAAALSPQLPIKPDQSLELYNIGLGANTLNDSDVKLLKIDHKRFTMADIGELERRVDKLEEVTSLSMLEMDTRNFDVLDSAGNNRTKAGFFVDNFSTQILSATNNPEYNASIDPQNQELRPAHGEDNIKLIYDSDASTNVIKKGDNIYLTHSQETYINQNLASRAIRINPFSVVVHEGTIQLSPSSDEWRDVERAAPKVVDGGTRLNTSQALMWNNWQWNWGGTPIEKLKVGSTTNTRDTSNSTQNITNVNKVVGEETVRKVVADRVIDVALIPFMRSRKIFFKAQGLRPNSKVFAFFDGKSVANFVRSETFQYHSDNPIDYGNVNKNITAHPEGSGTLQTDANGEVSGSFFIPNTSAIKFRTGTRQFKLLDISVDKEDDALAVARAPYNATGYIDTYQKEVLSTRVLTVEGTKTITNKRAAYQNRNDDDNAPRGRPHLYVGNGEWSRDPQKIANYNFGPMSSAGRGQAMLDKADRRHGPVNSPGHVHHSNDGGNNDTGCFLAGTLITMADGTKKAVETIGLGERLALGGMIFACGQFFCDNLWDYKGIKVAGSHLVQEEGNWVRVEESVHGTFISDETVVVYNFGTENRRILINDITFTDYFEVSEQEKLEMIGDEYFDNWRDHAKLADLANERVMNS